jgi:hypothetical protein
MQKFAGGMVGIEALRIVIDNQNSYGCLLKPPL